MNCEEKNASKSETTLEETWLRELKQKAESMQWRETHEERDAIIFRVPNSIRSADPEAYNPKIVSLGPYHHRRLHEWDEKLKWSYLNSFLARNKLLDMEDYLKLIKESEHRARNAYSEHVDMGSNNFAEMMLLDCCFVLEFILLQKERKRRKESKREAQQQQQSTANHPLLPRTATTTLTTTPMAATANQSAAGRGSDEQDPVKRTRNWALPLMHDRVLLLHDLLMLENQLPLFLLRSLFQKASIVGVPSLRELVVNLFKHFSLFPATSAEDRVTDLSIMDCRHLLHLFHICIVPTETLQPGVSGGLDRRLSDRRLSVPCARELHGARVMLAKKNTKGTFMDIYFRPPSLLDVSSFWSGRLEIPEILIDDDTNTLFRNLIAFEQCCWATNDHVSAYASAYASFMDAVVDTNEDVALLRQRGIVVNWLGSDKDVAQLFNLLCKEVTLDMEKCYLQPIMMAVNKHCEGRWNKCCASLKRAYFSNPWLLLSVIAAVILFALTFLQTLYSILSYEQQ